MKKMFLLFAVFFTLFIASSKKILAVPISPDKYFVTISQPGQVVTDTLTVFGRQELENVRNINIYVLGMRKVGEGNEREFYKPNPNDPTEAANWITLDKSEAYLSPGEDVFVNWTLTPGEKSACGTNLAAIVITPVDLDPNIEENSAISTFKQQVVSQIHIDVSALAATTDCPSYGSKLDVLEFKVDRFIPLFNYDNVKLLTRIENSGNLIARAPMGYITIKGFNVDREAGTIDFNEEELDIYPNTIRRFDDLWKDPNYPEGNILKQFAYELAHLRIGRYKAELGLIKNVEPDIVVTTSFWVFPWKLAALIAIFLLLLFAYITYRRRTEEKYTTKLKTRK